MAMRVLILTVGTRGDVHPYLALALGLKAAGHDAVVCTCDRFREWITDRGLAFERLDSGLLELLESDLGRAAFSQLSSPLGALRVLPKVLRKVGPIQRAMVADAWAACQSVTPDLLVYHPKMSSATAFASVLDVPAMLATPIPMLTPTGAFPMAGMPALTRGPRRLREAYHRGGHRLGLRLTDWGTRAFQKTWRRKHDPKGLSRGSGPTWTADGRPVPALHAYSRVVCSQPDDWPKSAAVTGNWFLPEEPTWQPPEDLTRFLNAGSPPVCLGFGSMAGLDTPALTRLVREAVDQAGVRAVLLTGWGGLECGETNHDASDRLFAVDAVPHDWLFPQVSAVVHHGGAGTTAAGLRAGRPSVVCPFGLDQPFWGRRVHALGCGPPPIRQSRLTAEKLADAIRTATTDPEMRRAAASVGEAMRQEDGVSEAVRRIDAVLAEAAA